MEEYRDWKEINKELNEKADDYLKKIREEQTLVLLEGKKGIGSLPDDASFNRTLRSYLTSIDSMEVTDPYEKSVWVFASINAIAQNISRVPFGIYTEKKVNPKKQIDDGPLVELFTNPNPFMITSTLFFSTVLFMELYGEAFLVMKRLNVTEIPQNIWVINPLRFEPVYSDINGIKSFNGYWKYKVTENQWIELAPHEVLHLKYYNPYDPIRGLSPVEASRLGVEQDYFANKYNKQFFKDGVSLSGLIQVPEFLTDEQFNRMKNQFTEKHAGYSNAHKVGIIEGGATFAETKSMSQRDMEFNVLKKTIRGEILAAFKTNEVVLGDYSQIQSYEGIKMAHESFWKETLVPKIIYLEEFLWSKFFSKINNGRYWGGFDLSVIEALREDYNLKVTMAKILFDIGFPINAINKRLDMGFDDVPWGNTWWIKTGMMPVENFTDNIGVSSPVTNTIVSDPKKPSKQIVDLIWENYRSKQIVVEDIFKNKLKRFFFEQRKRVLANIYKENDIFNNDEERRILESSLLVLYNEAKDVGEELLKEEMIIDGDINVDEINIFIKDRVLFSSEIIINTIRKNLSQIIENKKTKEEKADSVRTFYNKINNRVDLIARTESCAIINGVRFIIMRQFGVKLIKWVSKEGGRHDHLNGKIINLGNSFISDSILRFPLDKSGKTEDTINCTCYLVPVIDIKI